MQARCRFCSSTSHVMADQSAPSTFCMKITTRRESDYRNAMLTAQDQYELTVRKYAVALETAKIVQDWYNEAQNASASA